MYIYTGRESLNNNSIYTLEVSCRKGQGLREQRLKRQKNTYYFYEGFLSIYMYISLSIYMYLKGVAQEGAGAAGAAAPV